MPRKKSEIKNHGISNVVLSTRSEIKLTTGVQASGLHHSTKIALRNRAGFDRYSTDTYQAMPLYGFTQMFENIKHETYNKLKDI